MRIKAVKVTKGQGHGEWEHSIGTENNKPILCLGEVV